MNRQVLMLLILITGWAGAHPVDEVVQGAYLTLVPSGVQLELDLTPGSQVAISVLKSLDANGDRQISTSEARAFAARVLAQSSLLLDGATLSWTLDEVTVPPYQNLALGSDTLRIYATAKLTVKAGAHTLSYTNRYQPAKSQCIANIFLQPGGGWTYGVSGQAHSNDGRGLTVHYQVTRS